MLEPVSLILGAVASGVVVWVLMHERVKGARARGLNEGEAERARLEERLALQERQMEEKAALLADAQRKLTETFQLLSSEALQKNNDSFMALAKTILENYQKGAKEDLASRQKSIEQLTQPIRERLDKFDGKLDALEKARVGAYSALDQQLKSLVETHLPQLHAETANLVKALRQPTTRGRWGEVQLRRVVEMAGMQEYCDFIEQESVTTDAGRLRPDMLVKLPGSRQIVIDSKTPIDAYLTAAETTDDLERNRLLADHARQVRGHIAALGKKDYFEQFDPTPEFVVMFVPGEAFFSAALAQDPTIIERGAEQRVIPASPTTLIALLKAVAYGWRQEALAQNAAEVAALGHELYDRIQAVAGHWRDVGRHIDQTVEAYNKSVGSLESRVLVSARRFKELKAAPQHKEIEPLEPVEHTTRTLTAPEMAKPDDSLGSACDQDKDSHPEKSEETG